MLVISPLFGSTWAKIQIIQRRFAWPLLKDDIKICEAVHIFKKFLHSKGNQTINEMKRQPTEGEKMLANDTSNKKLLSKIHLKIHTT